MDPFNELSDDALETADEASEEGETERGNATELGNISGEYAEGISGSQETLESRAEEYEQESEQAKELSERAKEIGEQSVEELTSAFDG